jgi:uncharacterized membrane protein
MNIADRYQIDETISGQNQEEWRSFSHDKNISYVVDQQNGNYSNQVSWDLTSIISGNSWMSLQESYLLIPMSTTLTCGTAMTASINANAVNLKSNFINYVDSIQFFVNGEQLIDQTSLSNLPLNVMDMLQMSQDDLKIKGTALNIQPDTCTSIRYTKAAATVSGEGYVNNCFLPNAAATTLTSRDYTAFNEGAKLRNLNTFLQPAAQAATALGLPPCFSTDVNAYTQILSPYFSNDGTTRKSGIWNYVVYLPLKRLSDLLSKYPLVKGSQIRLVLNFNASSVPVAIDATAGGGVMTLSNPTMTAGNTVTAMLTSTLVNGLISSSGSSACTLVTKIQTSSAAAVANTSAQYGFATLPNCRCYVPNYRVNPTYEERLLSNRVQKIRYMDWYQQPIYKIVSGAAFSQTLTTALTNVKCLIMIPFQTPATGLYSTATCPQFQSPFDTAPNTTVPGGFLAFQNFNVQISGINVFNQNLNYNIDNWAGEVQKIGLNGGLSREISSGLVDLQSWNWSPYVIADLSRRSEQADATYQSVTVQGTNNAGVSIDYYCFIGFEKEIEIDISTGSVSKKF